MNETAKKRARKVANGTASTAELREFKHTASLLSWVGYRGLGVVNYTSGERVKSWAALAADMLREASNERDRQESREEYEAQGDNEAEMDRIEEAEAEEMAADEAKATPVDMAPLPDGERDLYKVETSEPHDAPEVSYFYSTRTPTVRLSDMTVVDALITEGVMGVTEGLCESGASLECSKEDPSMGILRTLPESMLPGQEPAQMIQCLPCYEASAMAYVRKLHRAS
jgi:hypothetical protein